jgi:GNAT superfamily N-acetyltransferase
MGYFELPGGDTCIFRRMTARDVDAALGVMQASEGALPRTYPPPAPDASLPERKTRLLTKLLAVPGTSAHVAAVGDKIVAMVAAVRQDDVWGLPTLFVAPGYHGKRIGSSLLAAARETASDAAYNLIVSSTDPKAMRSYSSLGLSITPAMGASGNVDTSALPPTPHVFVADRTALNLVDEVDRRLRGGSRAPAAALLLDEGGEFLAARDGSARGFAIHLRGAPLFDGSPLILGADTQQLAEELFVAFLRAAAGAPVTVYFLTHRQQWAFRLAVLARLDLFPMGPIFSKGYRELPEHWILSGFFF